MTVKFSGPTLKQMRLNADISQSELSRRSGVNQSVISKMERGAIPNPSGESLVQIAAALSTDATFYTVNDLLVVENFSGERLRKIRAKKNISQAQMAEDLGVPRPTISRYETGAIKKPAPAILETMSDYLQVELEDLFSVEDNLKTNESAVPSGVKKGDQIEWKLSKPQVETVIERLRDIAPAIAASEGKTQKVTIDLNFNINLLSGS